VLTTGCATLPPAPPAPHTAVAVNAPFGKTWDAVIDVFAARNIAIKTLDRSSGLIVAEPQTVAASDARDLADCGTALGIPLRADAATWNILVRGDSTHATVRATVRFIQSGTVVHDCSSRGVWETALETSVKDAAEGKAGSR